MIEREYEFRVIDSAVTLCKEGTGQLLLIEGAPGLGKTSLLATLRKRAESEGFVTLQARSNESEGAFPYGVVRQLFEGRLACADPSERRRVFRGPAKLALPLFEYDSQGALPLDGDRQHMLLNGLYWMCVHMAERAPLALLLDDVWWVDAASLRFLHYLTTRFDDQPFLLAVTTDPAQKGELAEITHAIVSHPTARLLRLAPLSEAGVRSCLDAWLGSEADPRLAEACYQATGGVPFYLRELLDALTAAGMSDGTFPPSQVFDIAPPKVVRSVLRRLSPLTPQAVTLVEAMAVLGTADLGHAIHVADMDPQLVAEALGELADSGLLHPGVPPRFVYPVVRAAIYHNMPATTRNAAHARAARVLTRAAAPIDDIAPHLLRADVAGDQATVTLLRRAAQKAVAENRALAAVAYLTRAMQEPSDAERTVTLLVELGRAELRSQLPEALDHLGQAMELSDDPVMRGRIGLDLAAGLVAAARHEDAIAMLERLRKEVDDQDDDVGTVLDVALIAVASQTPHLRSTATRRLTELAESGSAKPGVAQIVAVGRASEALRRGESARQVGELAGHALEGVFTSGFTLHNHDVCAYVWFHLAIILAACDRLAEAERLLSHALADAHERGMPIAVDSYHAVRAWIRCQRGRLTEAEADARTMLERSNGLGLRSPAAVFAVGALAVVLTARQDFSGAKAVLRTYDFDASTKRSIMYGPVLFARGRLQGALEEFTAGAEDILYACNLLEDWDMLSPVLLHAADAAVLLHKAGRSEEAAAMADELYARARDFGAPRVIAGALRARALTAAPDTDRPEEAVDRLEEAAEILAGSEARLDYATTLVDLGSALRRRERLTQARQKLSSGLLVAQDCGAWGLVKAARSELSAMGVRVRVTEAGVASLTPQERRMADLAAEGIRNRDIAQSLFVTVKTVEWHLNRVYRKLGISSRHELAEALENTRDPLA